MAGSLFLISPISYEGLRTMKKILKHYKPYMARTVIQQIIYRLMVAAIILLAAWRFGTWNKNATILGDGFFFVSLVFLAGAWFNYLFLDGLHITLPKRKKKIKDIADENKHRSSMADYIDTEIINMSELTEEQRATVKFLAYLIPGVIMLAISLVAMFLL